MPFKVTQKFIITLYRLTMSTVLVAIVGGVFSYLFLMVFYTIDRQWAAPIVLSPTQEKVLAYQPQVSALEAALLKNKVDLITAQMKYQDITAQTLSIQSLLNQFEEARRSEASTLAKQDSEIQQVLAQKQTDTRQIEQTAADIKPLLESLDHELAAGLITKDEALARRLNLEMTSKSITDSRIGELALGQQGQSASNASETLTGNHASSLLALQSINSEAQLQLTLASAKVAADEAQRTVTQLQATVTDAERVMAVAKQSPYYAALTRNVTVAFVPYGNLQNALTNAPVYDCYLQVILCRPVGTVDRVYDAEEYAHAPLFKTDIKGKFVEVSFSSPTSSQSPVVFLGSKPLLL